MKERTLSISREQAAQAYLWSLGKEHERLSGIVAVLDVRKENDTLDDLGLLYRANTTQKRDAIAAQIRGALEIWVALGLDLDGLPPETAKELARVEGLPDGMGQALERCAKQSPPPTDASPENGGNDAFWMQNGGGTLEGAKKVLLWMRREGVCSIYGPHRVDAALFERMVRARYGKDSA